MIIIKTRNCLSYPLHIQKLILDNYKERTVNELAAMCNATDPGREYTGLRIRSWLRNRKLTARPTAPSESSLNIMTLEQQEYFRTHSAGKTSPEFAKELNEHFDLNLTPGQVASYRQNHKLPGGVDTRFKKGVVNHVQTEEEKKKFLEGGKKTRFKKGNRPQTTVPVGTEVLRKDGYLWIKVADPNKWRLKGELIWERANGQAFPRGMCLKYVDNDRTNLSPENLIVMNREENLILANHGWQSRDAELGAAEKNIARLICKTRSKRRELKNAAERSTDGEES